MSEFNVNEYWLERGRNYMQEKRTPPEFHRLQERFLLEILKTSALPIARVLELGCGFGRITRLLAETWPDARITALDLSPEQLANARLHCRECSNISFQQYDFYSGQPLPGADYDTAVAIEVFLHHPPEFVAQLFERLDGVARHIVNIDWSEAWPGPLPQHVWVHDYAKLFTEAGLKCATFLLADKIDGKQQKLFIAARELSAQVLQAEHLFFEQVRRLKPGLQTNVATSTEAQSAADWTQRLHLATDELRALIPAGESFLLVDEAQWGNVRELASYRVVPFVERNGQYWGPPADDETAIRELERQKAAGASHIAFAWPSFWWLEHYAGLHRHLQSSFPCVLENDRLIVFRLKVSTEEADRTFPTPLH